MCGIIGIASITKVINRTLVRNNKPYPPSDITELEILPGVLESLLKLRSAGFLLIVVTNQPDVARGTVTKKSVEKLNSILGDQLPIDEFMTCYHDNSDNCDCRKPLPGSIFKAEKKYNIVLNSSFMVGDRWRDIETGQCAGCTTIFINYGYAEKQPDCVDFKVGSLVEATQIILEEVDEYNR